MKYIPKDMWTVADLKFWKDGALWYCAVPRNDIATQSGLSWKNTD